MLTRLDLLPADQSQRITVYDQTGELGSEARSPASRVRLPDGPQPAGWVRRVDRTRRSHRVARTSRWRKLEDRRLVRLADGREGWVLRTLQVDGSASIEAWFADGTWTGPVSEDDLKA